MQSLIPYSRSPSDSVVKNLPANAGDPGSIPGLERSPAGGNGNPFQYSCLKGPTERGAWWAAVCVVAENWTRLSAQALPQATPRRLCIRL